MARKLVHRSRIKVPTYRLTLGNVRVKHHGELFVQLWLFQEQIEQQMPFIEV